MEKIEENRMIVEIQTGLDKHKVRDADTRETAGDPDSDVKCQVLSSHITHEEHEADTCETAGDSHVECRVFSSNITHEEHEADTRETAGDSHVECQVLSSNITHEEHEADTRGTAGDCDIQCEVLSSPITKLGKSESLSCRTCGKEFTKKIDLHVHRLTHNVTPKDVEPTDVDYPEHWHCTGTAEEMETYWCAVCKAQFEGSHVCAAVETTTLRGPDMVKPYECKTCGKRFTANGNLRRHELTHQDFRPFLCRMCDRRFSQKSHLDAHHLVHSKERPFECQLCGSSFTRQGNLKRHEKIHIDDKPFRCDTCGRRFSQLTHMKEHEARSHGADHVQRQHRTFECFQCKKTFTRKDNLKRHMLLHSRYFNKEPAMETTN